MWQEDAGTSADPRDIRITCDCTASLSLEELFQHGRLGPCPGERPWIGDRDPTACNASVGLRLLTRSAINTYFPQVARVLSLPQRVDELARRIETFWSVLEQCTSIDDVGAARRFNPAWRASLQEYPDDVVFNRLQSMHGGGAQVDAAEDPRIAEFQLLASGVPLIGLVVEGFANHFSFKSKARLSLSKKKEALSAHGVLNESFIAAARGHGSLMQCRVPLGPLQSLRA